MRRSTDRPPDPKAHHRLRNRGNSTLGSFGMFQDLVDLSIDTVPSPTIAMVVVAGTFLEGGPANGAHRAGTCTCPCPGTGECHDGAGGPRHLGRLGVRPSSAMPRRRSPDRALEPARTRSSEGLAGGDVPGRRHRLHASRLSALAIASGEKRRASACERQAVPADVRWGDLRASG